MTVEVSVTVLGDIARYPMPAAKIIITTTSAAMVVAIALEGCT